MMMMMNNNINSNNNNISSNNNNSNMNTNMMMANRTYQTLIACTILYLTLIGKSLDYSGSSKFFAYYPGSSSYDGYGYDDSADHNSFGTTPTTRTATSPAIGRGGSGIGDSSMIQDDGTSDTDNVDDEDISWLNRIKIGNFLGSGAYTDTFDVTLLLDHHDNDHDHDHDHHPMVKKEKKEYVIKFTGENRRFNEPNEYMLSSYLAKEISDRLTPHPNIPQTLFFAKSIPNPFWKNSTLVRLEVNKTSFENHARTKGRLRKSNYFSISVVEKMVPTFEHQNSDHILNIPAEFVPCFWQRLFEVLDYLHSKNVVLGDTKLWNFMISSSGGGTSSTTNNSKVVVFDFNMAEIYEPNVTNTTKFNKYGHYGNDIHDSVHEKDVYKIGSKRIKEFVEYQKKFHSSKYWKKRAKKSKYAKKLIPLEDIELLEDLINVMKYMKPTPSFNWLLNNTDYFYKYKNDTCILSW